MKCIDTIFDTFRLKQYSYVFFFSFLNVLLIGIISYSICKIVSMEKIKIFTIYRVKDFLKTIFTQYSLGTRSTQLKTLITFK